MPPTRTERTTRTARRTVRTKRTTRTAEGSEPSRKAPAATKILPSRAATSSVKGKSKEAPIPEEEPILWLYPQSVEVAAAAIGHQTQVYYESDEEPIQFPEGLVLPTPRRPPRLELKDFECIRTLGSGQYGKVVLVRTRRRTHHLDRPGTLFAMKVIEKRLLRYEDFNPDSADRKNNERRVLSVLPWSPFVCGVLDAFADARSLYLLTELIPCGTLHDLIAERGPLPARDAAFYFANLVAALAALEKSDIAHRDIKPDNILLGADGYLVLADFGSAVAASACADWVAVGTPSYMAPELTRSCPDEEYGRAADWWSAGCVLFELLARRMAFVDKSEKRVYQRIAVADYAFPPGLRVPAGARDLVARLLTISTHERLSNSEEVRQHAWLKNVDWEALEHRQYLAPYVPPAHNLAERWQRHPLPDQRRMPGLEIVKPPTVLEYDERFRERVHTPPAH